MYNEVATNGDKASISTNPTRSLKSLAIPETWSSIDSRVGSDEESI